MAQGRRSPCSHGHNGSSTPAAVTAANEKDRAQIGALAADVQPATGDHVELAGVDEGYIGKAPAQAAATQGLKLEAIKLDQIPSFHPAAG